MELIRQTPGSRREITTAAISPPVPANPGFVRPEVEDQGGLSNVWDAAVASFQRENTIIATAQSLGHPGADESDAYSEDLRSVNPFQIMIEDSELGEEFVNSYADAIAAGMFDFAMSKDDILRAADRWDFQKTLVTDMEKSFVGSLSGGLGAAVVDPTSYLPIVGPATKARSLYRVGRIVRSGLIGAGSAEVILQSTQDLRSIQESILNIGTAGIISGGIGALGELAKFRSHPLHKDHPNNPLRPENLEADNLVIRHLGERDVVIPNQSTAGAKQSEDSLVVGPGSDIELAQGKSKAGNVLIRGIDAAQRAGHLGVLTAKAFARKSTLARRVSMRLMDNSGRLTRANFEGEATGATAENIANEYRRHAHQLFDRADANFRTLTKDMSLGFRNPFKTRDLNRDWQEVTRRIMRGIEEIDDKLERHLVATWGREGADKIKSSALVYAEDIHTTNDHFRSALVRNGFLRDNAKFEKLEKERASLRAQRKSIKDEFRLQKSLAPKDADIADLKSKRDDGLEGLKADLERVEAAHDAQKALPADLGRDYGIAQVWDRNAITLYPEEFKSFLRDVLAKKPDEDWLSQEHGLTQADLDDLRVTDLDRHAEIIEQWAGDEWVARVVRAESELKAAQHLKEDADNELSYVMQLLGLTKRDEVSANLSAARKKRDQLAGDLDARRKKRAQVRAEQRAFKDAATASRTRSLERQLQDQPIQSEAGAREFGKLLDAQAKRQDAEARLERSQLELDADAFAQPNAASVSRGKLSNAVAAERRVERSTQAEDQARTRASEDPIETSKVSEPNDTVRLARAEQRARDAAEELGRLDAEVKAAEEKLLRLDEALRRAETRQAQVKDLKSSLKTAESEAKSNSRIAKGLVGKSERALRSAYKATPLEDSIKNIYEALASGKDVPGGVLDERMPQSGRLKARQLHLTPEERLQAEAKLNDEGMSFLNTDLGTILQSQYDALSGQLAIRESLGGRSWEEVMDSVRADYESLRDATSDLKEKDQLVVERNDVLADLATARDRILHTEDDGDSAGWLAWTSRLSRLATLARFGSGFGLSSLSDAAAVALRHPILHSAKRFKQVRSVLSQTPGSELAAMIHATEVGSHSVMSASRTAASRFGDEDLWRTGNPAKTRTGRRVAGGIDHSARFLANASIWSGGLRQWTRHMKASAAVMMSYRVRDLTARYADLTPNEVADLASTGIGKTEAGRIDVMMKKHGTENSQGWFEPNLEEWSDLDAVRAFRLALQRDMNRSVVTPGIGDTPRLMSHWAGRFFMQFWSHPLAFTNRFVIPAVQRGILDPRVGISLAILMTSSAAVTMMKSAAKGNDPFEKIDDDPGSFVAEVIDRSGLLGYFSPYAMTAGKMTGLWESSRYERSSAFSNLFGVNAGLLANVRDLGDSTGSALAGDVGWEEPLRKLNHLRPFDFLLDLGEALNEQATN